jgi:hypothetical protein
MHQNDEAVRLLQNYERYGSREDLDKAISIMKQVIDITAWGSKNIVGMLSDFGVMLGMRFERTGSMDLNRVVEVADMAVDATPQDHPNRAMYLNNLGSWPGTRFERTGSMDDINRALSYYEEGWACHTFPPSIRIVSARRAANILASRLRWEEAVGLLEGAVKILPIVSPRLLANNDKQHMLGQFSGLASMAAAICLEAGKDEHQALELLELGRCVIAGLLLEMRTDISNLKQKHPMLAAEFESLQKELDSPPSETTPLGDTERICSCRLYWTSKPRWQLSNAWDKSPEAPNFMLSSVLPLPRFSRYLPCWLRTFSRRHFHYR